MDEYETLKSSRDALKPPKNAVNPFKGGAKPGSSKFLREGDTVFLKGGAWQGKKHGWECTYICDLGTDHVRVECEGVIYKEKKEYLYDKRRDRTGNASAQAKKENGAEVGGRAAIDRVLTTWFEEQEKKAIAEAKAKGPKRPNRFMEFELRRSDIVQDSMYTEF